MKKFNHLSVVGDRYSWYDDPASIFEVRCSVHGKQIAFLPVDTSGTKHFLLFELKPFEIAEPLAAK